MEESIQVPHEAKAGGLIIRINNRDIIDQMVPTTEVIARLIKAHEAKAILIDFRAMPGGVTFMDKYRMGETAARCLPRIPVGILTREDLIDPGRIGIVVATNRGAQADIFTDPAAAEAWFARNTQ